MAQDEFKDVNLTVEISNFKDRAKCPYCGEKPKKMEWSSEGLRIWCRNGYCRGNHYKIFVPIPPEELNLVKMTRALLKDWGKYSYGIKYQKTQEAS